MNHKRYAIALVFGYYCEGGAGSTHVLSLRDCHSCFGKVVQTGEVGELLLWRVNGVRSFLPIEHIRFCRQPVKVFADQFSSGVMEFQL